jgi:hypothetical protein
MQSRSRAPLFFSIAIAILLPAIAAAAGSDGLVPCGVSSDWFTATSCQACDIIALVQGLIMFLIGLAIPISMGMFAYAGILYFTQAANTENVGRAKKIFSTTAYGFVLALCAWLIVNTILNAVLDTSKYPDSSWFHIKCVSDDDRDRTGTIGDVILKHLDVAPEADTSATIPTCSDGFTYDSSTNTCVNGSEREDPTYISSSDAAARAELAAAGIGIASSGNCSDKTNPTCTSLDGIQQKVIDTLVNLKGDCGCSITVTGGTETGHSSGHTNGYKVDLSDTSSLTSYIEKNFTSVGSRGGDHGGPAYDDHCGNEFVHESSYGHWDVTVNLGCSY